MPEETAQPFTDLAERLRCIAFAYEHNEADDQTLREAASHIDHLETALRDIDQGCTDPGWAGVAHAALAGTYEKEN